jgi:hypothetical protein
LPDLASQTGSADPFRASTLKGETANEIETIIVVIIHKWGGVVDRSEFKQAGFEEGL